MFVSYGFSRSHFVSVYESQINYIVYHIFEFYSQIFIHFTSNNFKGK